MTAHKPIEMHSPAERAAYHLAARRKWRTQRGGCTCGFEPLAPCGHDGVRERCAGELTDERAA